MNARSNIMGILDTALGAMPSKFDSPRARVMLIAIGLQESRLTHRDQIVKGKKPGVVGPATGLWQFERGGGVKGVLSHPASKPHLPESISGLTADEVWRRLVTDDTLAAQLARLLLWTDSRALPEQGDSASGWNYYIRNWRPGKPHQATWGACWREAETRVYGYP